MFEEREVFSPEKENSPFLSIKGTISLIKEDKTISSVNLEEVEPISN